MPSSIISDPCLQPTGPLKVLYFGRNCSLYGISCQAGNQMQEESVVICPFCETEQHPSLLFEGLPAAVGILYSFVSKPHKTLWATWKSFKAVTFEGVSMTPALKCNHCRNGFVHCPHCSSTTLLTDVESTGQLVNCSDCKIRLEVSDR